MKAQSSEGSSFMEDGYRTCDRYYSIRVGSPKMGTWILLSLFGVSELHWIEALRYTSRQLLNFFQVTSLNKDFTSFSRQVVERFFAT